MSAIHDRLLTDLQGLIQSLDLSGSSGVIGDIGSNVYVQLAEEELNVLFPCVLVSSVGETEEEGESDLEDDVVIYPVRISILDQVAPNYQQRRPTYQDWRHQIARKLRGLVNYPLLDNVPELHDVRLRNLPTVDPRLPEHAFFQAGLVALCYTNETRTRSGA